ncbi:bifunctional protein-serine/threonine kinase/phosphatase [Hydrogenovibrio kuenenii]|uniref:bifunctional protein-serine/threonine kinase/phosphatase n=1 Tax=Hydrogenovibrio kuenenii TaxID=63658 RepID=UPI0004641E3B|nr:bifunctional protein-serine/threonine kinase/phosphatase [Hydrogenovibrio kuenenii]
MTKQLNVSIGQYSDKGRKALNQDFYGSLIPEEPLLSSKGIVIALADGISSSQVSQIASETAVKGFLMDYFSTSEAWRVKTSAQSVLLAINSWLFSQTRRSQYRYNKDKGFVCTFSSVVFKSTTAHLFHAGDSRIYRIAATQNTLEQLTEDHRTWLSSEESFLSRALGVNDQLEIDYQTHVLDKGDVFILTTDGVYEFLSDERMVELIGQHEVDLDIAAKKIVDEAYQKGSDDNLTVQIVRVDNLPDYDESEAYQQMTALPFPPQLEARMQFDGYEILRDIHNSSRSHVFLARDLESKQQVILKVPSIDLRDDAAYLERFLLEEWIARRIEHANVLKPIVQTRKRNYLYITTEYIEGQTLAQWMLDNPKPDVETVRKIVEQIAKGLRAFHRLEMLHQDIRPNNIMIDRQGTVKIIDFGSTRVAGLAEITSPLNQPDLLGTAQYTAPEYFLGDVGSTRSDQFSLAVITYQLLSGRLPYGIQVAKARTKADQRKLRYRSVVEEDRDSPIWIDEALRKALQPEPQKRYREISEFIYDLRHPNQAYLNKTQAPLIDRNPVLFWKSISLILLLLVLFLLAK